MQKPSYFNTERPENHVHVPMQRSPREHGDGGAVPNGDLANFLTSMVRAHGIEALDAVKSDAEAGVAVAGADLEIGVRTKKQREAFRNCADDYELVMSFIVADKIAEMQGSQTSTDQIKHDINEYLLNSYKTIVQAEIDMRLDRSRFERTKEWLGGTRLRRGIGKLAITSSSTGIAYGAIRYGLDFEAPAAAVAGGLVALRYSTHQAASRLTTSAHNQLGDYQKEASDDSEELYRVHKAQLSEVEARLYVITGKKYFGADIHNPELVRDLMESVRESLLQHYQVKRESGAKERMARLSKLGVLFGAGWGAGEEAASKLAESIPE